jgi:hypothetical protein
LAWLGSDQDAEGNWHTGAIAAAADDVCAAAIMSAEGIIKVSVHYDISYFAPAKLHVRTHGTTTYYCLLPSFFQCRLHSLLVGTPKEILIFSVLFASPLR